MNTSTPNLTNASTSAATSMPTSPVSAEQDDKSHVKDEAMEVDADYDPMHVKKDHVKEVDPTDDARATRLSFLLDKSTIYAKIIGDRMARQQIDKARAEKKAEARKANKEKKGAAVATRGGLRETKPSVTEKQEDVETAAVGAKRKRKVEDESAEKKPKVEEGVKVENTGDAAVKTEVKEEAGVAAEAEAEEEDDGKQYSFAQPELITGATLRDYQLAGVQWMISLYENGLNGILADEMGLGKTLQTIAFLAHLRSKGTWGPFLIVCPLSVLNNWITEFEKFAPTIPVIMYHGTQEHRAELRNTRLSPPSKDDVGHNKKKGRQSAPSRAASGNTTSSFPIVVTTYEICMRDQKYLSNFKWKFIVVDEGHRLKNLDCRLIRELKTYTSANRMILTGTPLHNNLAELWSLLNFILPDIFDDLDSFQQWFNFDAMSSDQSQTDNLLNKTSVVTSLHAILKPFLLRRLKVDVEKDLPPKKEYLLYAPLTQQQKDIYQAIASGQIRQFLVDKKTGKAVGEPEKPVEAEIDAHGRSKRKRDRVNYKIEENDNRFIDNLEKGIANDEPSGVVEKTAEETGNEWRLKQATKSVNNMHLQNIIMQLRKISSHPFLFDWPYNPKTGELVVNQDLVNASGKMLLLNRLLDALFDKGHKVLIFSQFTTMLDVIEEWATVFKGFKICRIDGSTSQESRREQMNTFNNGGKSPDATKLFLLSTRAGGLGINLVEADTVIFFDQDWNPQMDLQAQDRAHRIGQTRPVLIFRLVSAHTIETKILQRAGNKRKLEALVISQGKFGRVVDDNGKVILGRGKQKEQTVADMARALLDLEGDEVDVASKDDTIISDQDLEILLDRSKEAMARKVGWSAGLAKGKAGAEQRKKGEKTAFEVFVPAKDDAADGLANMFNGEEEQTEE